LGSSKAGFFMKVAIIGSGVVGQATGIGLAFNGNQVIFNDINPQKLLTLKKDGYKITSNLAEAVANAEIIFVCVPTPTINKKIELKYVIECTKNIGTALKKTLNYTTLVFRSTIPPQTTRNQLLPQLETTSNLEAGKDFGVCMNPEFLREQSPLKDFLNPSRIIIGKLDKKSGAKLQELYSQFSCPLILTDLETAEMIKYTSNIFLAAKISFFNEIHMVCNKLGLDSQLIGQAAGMDPRIGNYGVIGGKPFGGMCLPKDLDAFLDFSITKGLNLKLIRAVAEVNQEMTGYTINQELKAWGE
jgi:UDPglucose 6-dehydrogenase